MGDENAEVVEALCELMAEYHVSCLIHVGCESGREAAAIAKRIGCKVFALDGNPTVAARYPGVIHAVIGAQNGPATFYGAGSAGLSSLHDRGGEKFDVTVERLDSFCARHEIAPDALIIDTEGTTFDVLVGAGELLDSVKVIYAEVQNKPIYPAPMAKEVDCFLASRGFAKRLGPPAYDMGSQSNVTWVRP